MPADTFGVPVFDGSKEPAPAIFQGKDPGSVGTPHDVGSQGDDLSIVETWRSLWYPIWREQMILPHDTQNTLASDLVPLDEAESTPDLAMPFTGKRRGVQIVPN